MLSVISREVFFYIKKSQIDICVRVCLGIGGECCTKKEEKAEKQPSRETLVITICEKKKETKRTETP